MALGTIFCVYCFAEEEENLVIPALLVLGHGVDSYIRGRSGGETPAKGGGTVVYDDGSVQLSLDQIEAQSRRLVSRLPPSDTDRAYVFSPSPLLLSNLLPKSNYLLAQARVDAPALSSSIAHLNTSTIFTPLQPLQDTDVAGFLRHAHEQNLISTIEEGRRETQEDFYRMLEDRAHRDWEAKKRRVFEELGGRVTADCRALVELKQSTHARSALTASVSPSITLQMQSKMMAYDRVDVRFFLPMYIQLTKSLSQDQCE